MNGETVNPFNVTKAGDFSDQQIDEYWVDLPGGAGFLDLAKPKSPMPMLIIGGKGSGKTHILRYLSYALQQLRHENVLAGIRDEGFIGIYLRCGGLNAFRFKGKGQSQETWDTVFSQYMDLWLTQLTLGIVTSALRSGTPLSPEEDKAIAERLILLVDTRDRPEVNSLAHLAAILRDWQLEMDIAINNAAISRNLNVPIRSTPGRLVFGLPRILSELLPTFSDVQFLYLIDELENLTEQQQKYVNTLIREKEAPASFKIGARRYGVKTYQTYSAGETNKEGSEYERLSLDEQLRASKNYKQFAMRLCARRLIAAGYFQPEQDVDRVATLLPECFETPTKRDLARHIARRPSMERSHMRSMRAKLEHALRVSAAPGLHQSTEIEDLLRLLADDTDPLLEKLNLYLLFKDWSGGHDLLAAASKIHAAHERYKENPTEQSTYRSVLAHYGTDLLAQLLRESDQKQAYLGIDTFIQMSKGLPRNLLVVLKHVFQWSTFNGENPFRGSAISRRSQQRGVVEAANWFFRDAEVLGEEGMNVQQSIRRLAGLFRELRYSDKPIECSLCTFSANLNEISDHAHEVIQLAEQWSLLIRIRGGQRDRNSARVDAKYQLNSMLCPIWDLPIARRGAIPLSPAVVNAIFDPAEASQYDAALRLLAARTTAPRFGKVSEETVQERLF